MNRKNEFLLIVDGSSLLATSYYASLPKPVRKEKDEEKKEKLYPVLLKQDGQGHYCNALDLFFHTLFTIMTFQHPTHLVVCWDAGRNTFRKELWPAYKSNRQTTPAPLREQFETAYHLCEQLGICQVRDARYEADDFAGSIACQMARYLPVRILTRDKDYFQLITDRIQIWYGMADLQKVKQWRKDHRMPPCLPSRVVLIDKKILKKEFGYSPESVPMIKSLYGDASDNIPGVSGMGELRSIQLAEHYRSVEELYAPIDAAKTRAQRKKLAREWKTWGISVSPYSVLTRKGIPNRLDAREMADLCYTLGKIRTDLDLSDCFDRPFGPELFRIRFQPTRILSVLEPYNIELKIGRNGSGRKNRKKKGSATPQQPEACPPAAGSSRKGRQTRPSKSGSRSKGAVRTPAPALSAIPAESKSLRVKQEPISILPAKAPTPWQSARKAGQYRHSAEHYSPRHYDVSSRMEETFEQDVRVIQPSGAKPSAKKQSKRLRDPLAAAVRSETAGGSQPSGSNKKSRKRRRKASSVSNASGSVSRTPASDPKTGTASADSKAPVLQKKAKKPSGRSSGSQAPMPLSEKKKSGDPQKASSSQTRSAGGSRRRRRTNRSGQKRPNPSPASVSASQTPMPQGA